jgi:hypothetical protein
MPYRIPESWGAKGGFLRPLLAAVVAGGAGSRPRGRTVTPRSARCCRCCCSWRHRAAFWYLRNEEIEREAESVKRDTEIVQQQIGLRLIENQEQLVRLARELGTRSINREQFLVQAEGLVRSRPEVIAVTWLNARRHVQARHVTMNMVMAMPRAEPASDSSAPEEVTRAKELVEAFNDARDLRLPIYSQPFQQSPHLVVFQVHVPVIDQGAFAGTLMAEYSVEAVLRYFVPAEVSRRPLRGEGYRTSVGLIGNTLFWMVMALSVLTVWMLLGTWRHMRRRCRSRARWCRRPTSAGPWKTPCSPACGPWTWKGASPM